MEADQAYEEREITMLEFDRQGEVSKILSYTKEIYDTQLRGYIEQELMINHELTEGLQTFTLEQARKTSSTLGYQDNLLCTNNGDLYRIASIVNNKFSDEVAVNLVSEDSYMGIDSDQLNMGLFIVKAKSR
jgi:hypothetical protein